MHYILEFSQAVSLELCTRDVVQSQIASELRKHVFRIEISAE